MGTAYGLIVKVDPSTDSYSSVDPELRTSTSMLCEPSWPALPPVAVAVQVIVVPTETGSAWSGVRLAI